MPKLRDMPIGRKLRLIIMAATTAALVFTGIVVAVAYAVEDRREIAANTAGLALVIGDNSAAALVFDDPDAANETLAALRAKKDIAAAYLYDQEGHIFASYVRHGDNLPGNEHGGEEPECADSREYVVNRAIVADKEVVGTIRLHASLDSMYGKILRHGGIILIALAVAATVSLGISVKMEKQVSTPITALAATVANISRNRDYSVRAAKYSGDEVGTLVDGFNNMLYEIQQRDRELRSAQRVLEDTVETRTQELKREIVVRKEAEASQGRLLAEVERTNRELNDFAYVVSHDLKAPLRAIGSLSAWLSQDYGDTLDEEGRTTLNLLLARTKRMHDLIDGVLQYARSTRQKEEVTAVDLNEVIAEIVDSVVPPTGIEVDICGPLPVVQCDRTRMGQVFQNLISNAVKYMERTDGHIQISSADEDDRWLFRVRDDGPGIDEKYFGKIFQMFQTLSARDDLESTGVGLALVQKIVGAWGGTVRVDSTVGEGATFSFTIPKTRETNGDKDEDEKDNSAS